MSYTTQQFEGSILIPQKIKMIIWTNVSTTRVWFLDQSNDSSSANYESSLTVDAKVDRSIAIASIVAVMLTSS